MFLRKPTLKNICERLLLGLVVRTFHYFSKMIEKEFQCISMRQSGYSHRYGGLYMKNISFFYNSSNLLRTGEICMVGLKTDKICILRSITGEYQMLRSITSKIPMLEFISGEIRMLAVITGNWNGIRTHNHNP